MLFSFFSGAKISYSRYNKKERRMAKQLQEHHSLYKAPDSSKDLVKANTKKAQQRKMKLKLELGVQTTMPNNSSKCPPRRNTTNNTNTSLSHFKPTSTTGKLKFAPSLPKRTRSGRIVQKPDAFEFTHVKLPATKWRRIDLNDLSDSSNNTFINSQVSIRSTFSSKSKVSISSTFSSETDSVVKNKSTCDVTSYVKRQGDSSSTVRQSF